MVIVSIPLSPGQQLVFIGNVLTTDSITALFTNTHFVLVFLLLCISCVSLRSIPPTKQTKMLSCAVACSTCILCQQTMIKWSARFTLSVHNVACNTFSGNTDTTPAPLSISLTTKQPTKNTPARFKCFYGACNRSEFMDAPFTLRAFAIYQRARLCAPVPGPGFVGGLVWFWENGAGYNGCATNCDRRCARWAVFAVTKRSGAGTCARINLVKYV